MLERPSGYDFAVLHALAYGDSGDPREIDVIVGTDEPFEPRFPVPELCEPELEWACSKSPPPFPRT